MYYQGTYTIGALLTQSDNSNAAYAFHLTLNDSTLLSGLISDGTSQGPLTKFIYLGISRNTDGDSAASFDDAMLCYAYRKSSVCSHQITSYS